MESPPRNVLADTGPLFSLLHVGDADHARAVQFSRAFTDVGYVRTLMVRYDTMDLADASLVAVGERLGILDIISLDRRDFSRYRTRTRQVFTNHFPPRS